MYIKIFNQGITLTIRLLYRLSHKKIFPFMDQTNSNTFCKEREPCTYLSSDASIMQNPYPNNEIDSINATTNNQEVEKKLKQVDPCNEV